MLLQRDRLKNARQKHSVEWKIVVSKIANRLTREELVVIALALVILLTGSLVEYFRS